MTSETPRPGRRITVEVPADLYAGLTAAKLQQRTTLAELTRQGLRLVVEQARQAREVERARRAASASHSES
jgi:hypothetical protein